MMTIIPEICGGERHETRLEEHKEKIKSKDITMFSYEGRGFSIYAKKEYGKVFINATGGGSTNKRDGSYFIVKYETEDDSIFKKLQEVIDKYQETKGNGICTHVDGLPEGIGDTLNVLYSSEEKIYKTSNQFPTVSDEASSKFYEIFHEFVKKDGYDFNSEGSNVKLFDDADEEYVQGTWKGKHFGDEIEVTFDGKYVTIKIDGKITDKKEEYIIKEGFIRKNKLKEGTNGTSRFDYEEFEGVQYFAKKNWFTMVGYFYKEASSSCDLMNFNKEKPTNETNEAIR